MSDDNDLEKEDLELEDSPVQEDVSVDEDDDSSGDDESSSGKKYRRLTEAEKVEIRDKFELGQRRMTELEAEYGISRQALHKWFKKDGIIYGRRAHELSAQAKAAAAAVVERYAEKRMEWIEETRVSAHKDLKMAVGLAKKVVSDALKAGRTLSAADDDLKAAQRLNKIMRENYETRLRILDADNVVDKDDLPILKIDDLTAEQILEFHRNNGVEDEDELQEILKNFDEAKLD